jgi:ABC-2 type transport system ATP-binding protein
MNHSYVIETNALTKRYGVLEAVHALDLRVEGHGITGFLGRNGAGKSSTLRMLLGMIRPTSGTGTVLGKRIDDAATSLQMRRRIAYVGEDKQMYGYMSVEQTIRFTRSFYADWNEAAAQRLLKQYELPLGRKIRALSKGMRTKLALLLALSRRPELMILDEPSEGLDPVAIEELLQALIGATADGVAVFFSSHQIAEVERVADRVCIIDRGRLKVDVSMDQMRQDYRHVTIGFSTSPPPVAFRSDGITQVVTAGREIRALVSHDVDDVVAQAHGLGAISIEVSPISLRELFLETVGISTSAVDMQDR